MRFRIVLSSQIAGTTSFKKKPHPSAKRATKMAGEPTWAIEVPDLDTLWKLIQDIGSEVALRKDDCDNPTIEVLDCYRE